MLESSIHSITQRPLAIAAVALLTALLVVACDETTESPVQTDQSLVETDVPTPATTPTLEGTADGPLPGLTGDQGNDSPAVNGDDNVAGDEEPDELEELISEVGTRVEPTLVEATLGDEVTVVGILATHLSDRVITLEGVTVVEQPAEELLIIIPTSVDPAPGELDEDSLVAVAGEVIQVTDEGLANVDESIFDEHGEFLEGFRASWGILATDVNVVEEDGEQ